MEEQSLKSKAVRGVAWSTVNTVSNLLVGFVVGIILARKLMPEDYGAIAMIGVFTSILMMFTDGGLTTALVRKENRTEEDKCTVFYYNFVANYVVYGLIFIAAPWIADFYNMPILCKLARISSIPLLISPIASMQGLHFTVNINFKTPAFIGISANLINAVISIWMAYNGYGVYALAVPGIFVTIFRVVVMIAIVRWKPTKRFSWKSFKELFSFSSKLLASWILSRVYENITPLIVGKFFSPAQLGIYEKAQGWPKLPSQTLTNVLQNSTFPVLSKMQDDIPRLALNYRRMLKLSAYVIFPLMVGLAAVAKPLTIVLVTEKWIDSVLLMQLICISMMWYPIHAINLNILTVTGRSDYFFKLEVFKKIIGLTTMCCALPFGLVAFCSAGIFTSYLHLFINTWYSKKIINVGFVDQMKDLLPMQLNCFVMGALCIVAQMPFDNYLVKLLVAIPVGVIYYLISSQFFCKEQFNELVNIIKRK